MEKFPQSSEIKEPHNNFRKHIILQETDNFDGKLSSSYFETTNEAMIYLFGEPNKTMVGLDEVERYFGTQDDIEQEGDFIKLNYKIQMTEPSHLKFELVSYTTGNEIDPDNEQQWIILVEDLNHQEAIIDYLGMLFYFYVDDVPFRFYSTSSKEDK
ncbi:MAG: hypothetical protein J1E16_00445 [Muribaculaceae bacterium]|nr:hypothetical protein [Muribaculaceae bacterium]